MDSPCFRQRKGSVDVWTLLRRKTIPWWWWIAVLSNNCIYRILLFLCSCSNIVDHLNFFIRSPKSSFILIARFHQIPGTFRKQFSTNRVPDVGRQHGKFNSDVITLGRRTHWQAQQLWGSWENPSRKEVGLSQSKKDSPICNPQVAFLTIQRLFMPYLWLSVILGQKLWHQWHDLIVRICVVIAKPIDIFLPNFRLCKTAKVILVGCGEPRLFQYWLCFG